MAKRCKQRAERLLDENNGVLAVSKVIGSGIPRPGVYDFARSRGLGEPPASSWAPTSSLTSSTCSRRATPRSCSRTRCPPYFHDMAERVVVPIALTVEPGYHGIPQGPGREDLLREAGVVRPRYLRGVVVGWSCREGTLTEGQA